MGKKYNKMRSVTVEAILESFLSNLVSEINRGSIYKTLRVLEFELIQNISLVIIELGDNNY